MPFLEQVGGSISAIRPVGADRSGVVLPQGLRSSLKSFKMKSESKHLLAAAFVMFIAALTASTALGETSFYFSGPNSYVSGGETELITTNNGTIEFDTNNYTYDHGLHLLLTTTAGEWWSFDASTIDGSELQVGLYTNATRFPFNNGNSPGLDFSGCGRGDNTLTGWFKVESVVYSNSVLISAAVDFVQYDEGILSEETTGTVHYNVTPPPILSFSPTRGFASSGPVGGPFSSPSQTFLLTNSGGGTLNWSIINTSAWLNVSQSMGSLAAGDTTTVTVTAAAAANSLPAGDFQSSLVFSNAVGMAVSVPFELSVGQFVLNGGFETGDFSDWIQSGTTNYTYVTNEAGAYVHFGTCGALLGAVPSPGNLSQNVPTTPGQAYVLSFWLCNPTGASLNKATPNLFQARWNGNLIYAQTNITSTAWTKLQFNVTASGTVTPLEFSFEDGPAFLALDDVSLFLPTSGISAAPVTGFSLNASSCLQMTWSTSPGLNYQLQYTTNLSQPAWVNLGGPVTANANSLTLTDTNNAQTSPQRFYQLSVAP